MSKFEYKPAQEQQADAWFKVCDALDIASPSWIHGGGTGEECAVDAINKLAEKAKAYDELIKFGMAAYA